MPGFAVVGLEGVYMSSLGMFLDAFELIRRQVTALYQTRESITMETRISLLTPDGRPVRMAGGRRLAADAGIERNSVDYDLIHIPGFVVGSEDALGDRLADVEPLCRWLRRQHGAGALCSASGAGVFLLAESGLLNGGVAALTRQLIPLFRRRYPGVRVDHRSVVVEHDRVLTGSGLAADAQLLVRLVEQSVSPELARWLGDIMSLHLVPEEQLAEDPLVANAQIWLEERLAQDLRIADLARTLAVSQQTLLRHFRRHLNTTPREYVQRMRIEAAQRMLRRTRRPIDQVAALVGYDDVQSFRKVFREHTGTSPGRYRAARGEVQGDSA